MTLYQESLPDGIESRMINNGNGLEMHVLEAGAGDETILLLHGFPELAYSWRRVMPALAADGYRVIAPDQRGYGLTTGWDWHYDTDLSAFRFVNLVRDVMGLLAALEVDHVKAVIGHDFGSNAAAHCALFRPDIFRACVMMSAPYGGPPAIDQPPPGKDIHLALGELDPPRKHYHLYYSTREANENMWHGPHGVHDFLRAYFHYKSADWEANKPYPLKEWSAEELAKLPTYYVMNLDDGMAETAAAEMPSADDIAACQWLPEDELSVYSETYEQTGFQGGLNWYRGRFVDQFTREMQVYSGRTIDVPATFISGASDWGVYQAPGALDAMQNTVCPDFRGCHLLDGAGHWVQQEQSGAVNALLLAFLSEI